MEASWNLSKQYCFMMLEGFQENLNPWVQCCCVMCEGCLFVPHYIEPMTSLEIAGQTPETLKTILYRTAVGTEIPESQILNT